MHNEAFLFYYEIPDSPSMLCQSGQKVEPHLRVSLLGSLLLRGVMGCVAGSRTVC